MDKITNSSRNISAFGGLNFVIDAVKRLNINALTNKYLGKRSPNAVYQCADIVQSLLVNSLTQGEALSDIEKLKSKFNEQIDWKCPSADTIEYVCKQIKSENIVVVTDNQVVHELNHNDKFNEGLIAMALLTNELSANQAYVLDFDNIVIPTEKQDAKRSYKKVNAYHPSFATIGRIPVHLENRNGNTPARYGQTETLTRCFDNLKKQGIKISHFRADSASYQADVINLAEKNVDFFYIRNISSAKFTALCESESLEWKSTRINDEYKEIASIEHQPKGANKSHRVVVTRSKVKDGQTNLFTGAYTYYGILTNNRAESEAEVVLFYNQRADSENTNRFLLNDFNLNHLPFMDMDTNTVYMYMMSMCATLFEWIKKVLIKNKTANITISMRAKNLCHHYICVASEWIKKKGEKILIVYSKEKYAQLQL